MDHSLNNLKLIRTNALDIFKKIQNLDELENFRVEYLGRKSEMTNILRSLKTLSHEDRKEVGKVANKLKNELDQKILEKKEQLKNEKIQSTFSSQWLDVTIPSPNLNFGHKHPISQMLEITEDIFTKMGFDVVYPNEIDDEFNTFTAVNIPEDHPAKDMWDTFWTEDHHIAIPHTSAMQHRILKSNTPPIQTIVPGRCFRNEATDARHEHTFYQVEGVFVAKGVTMANMLATLKEFFSEFFEKQINVLFTPDFFPFVEPGGMMSIDCSDLGPEFEKISKGTGWLEVLGCGMIHPNVLKMANIDPDVYSGFAWGFGLERIFMLKHQVEDVRLFHGGDLRFTKQF